jgi:sorting and assembly machinery component 37
LGVLSGRLSTVDLRLYAHLALLLTPLPNPLLADLLRSTYPALIRHHDRISALLPDPPRIAPSAPSTSWWDMFTSSPKSKSKATNPKTAKDKSFERARWAWFATAGFGMLVYLFASGIVQIEFSEKEDGEWKDASEFEDDEEEEEIIEIIEEDEE